MNLETEAFILGATEIHSNKSGRDFIKVNLIIEGEFVGFFTTKDKGVKMLTSKPFQEFTKSNVPTRCVAKLKVKFTPKGTYVDLEGIM